MEEQTKIVSFGETDIQSRILTIRGVQVMLDRDLAELYGVKTKALNQAVKRNIERFPERFMFRLIESEMNELVTKCDRFKNQKHASVPMCAFTEQGVAMLSAVLRSEVAITVSIRIMDAFVVMRRFVSDHTGLVQRVGSLELRQLETDKRIDMVFDALDRGNLLPSGILPAGTEFDSLRYVSRLVEGAKSEIVLIDPYSDAVTLEVLAKKTGGVKVRLYCKDRGQPTPTEILKFNRQYKDLSVTINSLGRRVTSYSTRDPNEIAKLCALLPNSKGVKRIVL